MSNKIFFDALKTTNVKYMLCDLHVHSIASADVLEGDRYEQLDDEEKKLIDNLAIKRDDYKEKWAEYDDLVANKIKPEDYLKLIVERRNKIADLYDLSDGKDWAVIAITDHNSCDFSCKLSEQAWKTKNENRVVVLPGMELEVEFKVLTQDYTKVHICIIFAPCVKKTQIYSAIISAYKEANATQDSDWNFGNSIKIENIETFISKLRNDPSLPALCIAAHVGNYKGMKREITEAIERCDFTGTQAEYARLTAELEEIIRESVSNDIKSYKKEEVKRKITLLENKIKQESHRINLESLKLIGKCGFDALQVSNKQDDVHYRCLHRFRPEHGRAVAILCSDAHRSQDVFNCGNDLVSYIKFPSFNSQIAQNEFFESLKKYSIRFGETRFISVSENKVSCFIRGIEISPDTTEAKKFWPFKHEKFTIPFSPNLNCLIGGRGSGKSAMIESLAFVLDSNDDFNKQAKSKEKEDWYRRAAATLAGCKIKICWISSKECFGVLSKRSLFLDRFFSSDNSYGQSDYRDMTGNEVTDNAIKSSCKIQLFRMGVLEKLAVNDEQMRALFDEICGTEIKSLGDEIQSILRQLKEQRQIIKPIFQKLSVLTKDDSPLRKYVVRKKQYDDVNTDEMKGKFDKLDQAVMASQIANQAKQSWDDFGLETIIGDIENTAVGFFNDIDKKTKNDDGNIVANTKELRVALFDSGNQEKSLKDKLLCNVGVLAESITKTSSVINSTHTSIGGVAKKERDSLEKAGMPTGAKQRDAKKTSFNEAEQALRKYEEQFHILCKLYKGRLNLFNQLEALAKKRTRLRVETAQEITRKLIKNLDASILEIEADAQAMADKREFDLWLDGNLFPPHTVSKNKKIEALLKKGLLPANLKKLLFGNEDTQAFLLVNENLKVSEGKIDSDAAMSMIAHGQICYNHTFDEDINEQGIEKDKLPERIQKGIKVFTENQVKIDAFMQLDEIVFDDIPEIRLKDRPNEMPVARPITELSPGQRCSAVLPIILLNGDCPLIIDQPEDNLDNRLVREVVVNILAAMKLQRQIIMATHNPNLPVLGDVEQAVVLKAVLQDSCELQAIGDIDCTKVIHSITEIMEGGREAFQYRQSIYQNHWDSPVEELI
ncbi:MAG: ATP-binding protein [Sedimentisphaerales bacterium]